MVPAIKDDQGDLALLLGQHWKRYDADPQTPPPGVTVNLEDQFHKELDVEVGVGRYLCNPVEKNAERPPIFPDEHLACYDILQIPLADPPHSLEDQFGLHLNLVVENPEALCVPSLKFLCLSTSLRRQSVIGEGLCVGSPARLLLWTASSFVS
jgi:hypothetical protein